MNREFLKEAGLREQDLPAADHPLLQNNEPVNTLGDLVEVRDENQWRGIIQTREEGGENANLDVNAALTFPHPNRDLTSADLAGDTTDFDADARTATGPDDEDDASYMTRDDVEQSMLEADPDPSAGMDSGEFVGHAVEEGRAPNFTGTGAGIAPGMSTHVAQDLGADGFQVMEAGDENTFSADTEDEGTSFDLGEDDEDPAYAQGAMNPNLDQGFGQQPGDESFPDAMGNANEADAEGHRIPVHATNPSTRDDALDATRTIR